mgnify:CR=1 FL=1
MNKTWTDEQTKESVRRQKKALYIAIPIIVAFIFAMVFIVALLLNSFVDEELKEMEIQQLIEKGYLNADYTQEELSDLCLTSYNDFEEDYTNTCFWFL